jgi:hypothetical protein
MDEGATERLAELREELRAIIPKVDRESVRLTLEALLEAAERAKQFLVLSSGVGFDEDEPE